MSITVTRGLVELKTIDSRIKKALNAACFVTYKTGASDPKKKITPNHFQKITDMIEYRNRLKAAVVQSNAVTKVTINGQDYTVAEAIERKNSIEYQKNLLRALREQLSEANNYIERYNPKVQARLDAMLEKSF